MVQNCLDSNCKWDPSIFIEMLLEILYDWFSSDLGSLTFLSLLPRSSEKCFLCGLQSHEWLWKARALGGQIWIHSLPII